MTTPVPGQREGREKLEVQRDAAFADWCPIEITDPAKAPKATALVKAYMHAWDAAWLESRRQALEDAKTHLHKRIHNPTIQGLITAAIDELLSGEVIPQAGEEGGGKDG